jgi:hypothetical protein
MSIQNKTNEGIEGNHVLGAPTLLLGHDLEKHVAKKKTWKDFVKQDKCYPSQQYIRCFTDNSIATK